MTELQDFDSLRGNLLLAVPRLADPFFSQTVTLICEHNQDGAMGLVINQPTDVTMQEVFEQLELVDSIPKASERTVGYGGPVGQGQGFLLHRSEQNKWSSSIEISEEIEMSASSDIIEALSKGEGPSKWLFVLGYAGWSAGQLETELTGDSWITTTATADLVFDTPAEQQLKLAASQLGIDLSRLSPTGSA